LKAPDAMAYALSLCIDQELLSLNRAVGELRRRNLAIESLAVGPGNGPGETRLTVIVNADDATAEMAMRKLDKLSGVHGATRFRIEDAVTRELALVKVRVPPARFAALLEVCARYKATVVAELPDEAIVELAGSGSCILAFVGALEPFGIRELVRSGPVALARASAS
jgi:acetolactate synthase-1/3 small subunit